MHNDFTNGIHHGWMDGYKRIQSAQNSTEPMFLMKAIKIGGKQICVQLND